MAPSDGELLRRIAAHLDDDDAKRSTLLHIATRLDDLDDDEWMVEWWIGFLAWRDSRFKKGNDRIWGAGNWIRCARCPDSTGFPSYHHKDAHS